MRGLSKTAKFLIICAAVFFVGLVCAIVGVVTGGPQDIEKLADRYDWIQGSPGERGVTTYDAEEFRSVEVTGDADLWIVGKDFYKKASWLADQDVLEQTELDSIKPNQVIVVAGDKMDQPEIAVEKGVLKINAGSMDFSGVNLNLTDAPWYPKIMVCLPGEALESLNVSGQIGDVNVLGTAWENANIGLNTGDIEMEGVKSGGLTAESDTGDVELQGKFMGMLHAATDTGDIEIDTSLAKAEYGLQLKASAGDIKLKEAGKEEVEYESTDVSENGGPHRIDAVTDTGDIRVTFGN